MQRRRESRRAFLEIVFQAAERAITLSEHCLWTVKVLLSIYQRLPLYIHPSRGPGAFHPAFFPATLSSPMATAQNAVRHVPTRRGVRLIQHGTVLSEVLRRPGPTHTIVDVLAALISVLAPPGRIGLLGFAGGATIAPLRALGCQVPVAAVDKSRDGWQVFKRLCRDWAGDVQVDHLDAERWLQKQSQPWAMILEDLSITEAGDVVKPEITWTRLPRLMRASLQPNGVAIFNLLPPAAMTWAEAMRRLESLFVEVRVILFKNFENRVVVAGAKLPTPRALGSTLRKVLRKINSTQAEELSLRRSTSKEAKTGTSAWQKANSHP